MRLDRRLGLGEFAAGNRGKIVRVVHGKSKDIKAPNVAGTYSVVAVGPGTPGKAANTTLTVVKKK